MGARRLGITQFLINHGIARLEEVRSADGKLENIYVRVRHIIGLVKFRTQCFSLGRPRGSSDERARSGR